MIEFQRIELSRKAHYEQYLFAQEKRGCEYSFANLYLWGRQHMAQLHGCIGFFSHFNGRSVYPFPVGPGDKKAVIEDYIRDSRERGIPCRVTGMTAADADALESWFPGLFLFRSDCDSFDYVYAIDDLADLRGRKYQKKRNHFNKFCGAYPDAKLLPLTAERIPQAEEFVADWYARRESAVPHSDFALEKRALFRAFRHLDELEMEACALMDGDRMLAITMASRLSPDTFDIHFEKALEEVDGAYAAVNCLFARHLRLKYPDVRFLDREEDMGIEGLRKAKLSYLPHHMQEKHWAHPREDLYED